MPRFCRLPPNSPRMVADLRGRFRRVSVYVHVGRGSSGDYRRFDEEADPASPFDEGSPETQTARGLSPYILGRIRQLLEEYAASGRFTAAELRTMDALLYEGLSLREFAAREQVSDEAIRARLVGRKGQGGLLKKSPRFARWWRFASSWRKRGRSA